MARMMYRLPKDEEILNILKEAKNIAVVGLSQDPSRDSYKVALYLKEHGYRIIPVNPMYPEVLGEKSYPNLDAIPDDVEIDIVDIFRKPADVPPVVEAAIRNKAKVVWMQETIVNHAAASAALEAGLKVVMDRCTKKEHQRLISHE